MDLKNERAQGTTEELGLIALAVVAAATIGFFVKNFVSNEINPEVEESLDK